MRATGWAYVVITAFAAAGCIFLLLDQAMYAGAADFRSAVECADVSSAGCYQLYPGVIQSVRRYNTSTGEEDRVSIASRGTTVSVKLYPGPAAAPHLQPGSDVTVEWYVGDVATVWIDGYAVPSSTNLAAAHPNFAYVGGILVWIAALFLASVVLYHRLVAAVGKTVKRALDAKAHDILLSETVVPPGDTGWVIRPRLQELYLLPLGLALLVLVSIRPFMNPDMRWLALASDVLLFGLVFLRIALMLRNEKLAIGRTSISHTDWRGRTKSWPIDEVEVVSFVGMRWYDVGIPAILFIGKDGSALFGVTSLFWDVFEIARPCQAVGLDLAVGLLPPVPPRFRWRQRAAQVAVLATTTMLLALSFYPLPPSSIAPSP